MVKCLNMVIIDATLRSLAITIYFLNNSVFNTTFNWLKVSKNILTVQPIKYFLLKYTCRVYNVAPIFWQPSCSSDKGFGLLTIALSHWLSYGFASNIGAQFSVKTGVQKWFFLNQVYCPYSGLKYCRQSGSTRHNK